MNVTYTEVDACAIVAFAERALAIGGDAITANAEELVIAHH